MRTQGRFITFEGGEGAGKSTQTRRLARALESGGFEVVTSREPGGSPGAELIRELLVNGEAGRWSPTTESLLHFAARRDHLERSVWPALDRGAWVLCDRFADSTMAYQGWGLGLDCELVAGLYRLVVGSFAPDLTILLDLPAEAGLARALARSAADRYEGMDLAFHRRLRDGFLNIARLDPERFAVVDATPDQDTVAAAVLAAVKQNLLEGRL
ncbi:MAG: dTMP kinase, partial [Rhodospirillaceae bacterium]